MHITTIAFDGMHRCGKGTQIQMLKHAAQAHYDLVLTMRGEYYREGEGKNSLTDPISLRWQHNKTSRDYETKSRLLNRELRVFFARALPHFMERHKHAHALVILDRSVVGKYMFAHAESYREPTVGNDFLQVNIGKQQTVLRDIIIPDLIFVLQPSKEQLLQRLAAYIATQPADEVNSLRNTYKKTYIPGKYDAYYLGLKCVPDSILNRTVHIKSDAPAEYIHEIILRCMQQEMKWPHISYGNSMHDI